MIKLPTAAILGEEVRRCLRRQKVTQQLMAERLGVPNYVLARMLRGSLLFSPEQLETVLQLVDPGEENAARWRTTCASLQSGLANSTQGDNTYWRALRERRGLSLPMLSNRTGIKVSRLAYIESVGAEKPQEEEEQLLRRVFGVSEKIPGGRRNRIDEPLTSEGHQCVIPLLYLDDLLLLERDLPLEKLSKSRSREDIYWEIASGEPVYAVLADCKRLQVTFPGFAVLIVSERNNGGFHQLELRHDRKNNFALYERSNGVWMPVKYTQPGATFASPMWSLPVLDMIFKPYDLTLGVNSI